MWWDANVVAIGLGSMRLTHTTERRRHLTDRVRFLGYVLYAQPPLVHGALSALLSQQQGDGKAHRPAANDVECFTIYARHAVS